MNYTTLKKQALESFFSRMNDMQRKAVFQAEGAVLIIAGAGSGKTTVLCNRIANIMRFGNAYNDETVRDISADDERFLADFPKLEHNPENARRLAEIIAVNPVNPWNILAITFTNKAASELKQRLIAMIGDEAERITASTFHSACVKILRREIERLGYKSSFTIYDTGDSESVIKDCMGRLNIDAKIIEPKKIMNIISRCKDKMQTPEEYEIIAGKMADLIHRRAAEVYKMYQNRLRAASALDFDDIIFLTVKLFEQFPDVLDHYRRLYRYIMVDEYQDTNIAQYRLVSLLAGEDGNLTVVGDDDQSIYRFRGATIENILNFEKRYKNCEVIRLEQNYRSTENILNAANAVISHNQKRKSKSLWSELGEGEKIECSLYMDGSEEARAITDIIEKGVKSGMKYSDFALLYRSNEQSRAYEQNFVQSGVPYKIVGGFRFYERKEIKDIMAYLALLNNPFDITRFRRAINEPKRGIGDATVEEVVRIAEGLGITPIEVCRNAGDYETLSRKTTALKTAANLFDELDELADTLSIDELIDAVGEKSGYYAHLLSDGDKGAKARDNIAELKSGAVALLQENPELTLPDYLEMSALASGIDGYDSESDRVSMMTMHSAKGLEFDTVFIVGAEDNLFPSRRSMGSQEDMEEERRLAYVAITRAKRKLYITHAVTRIYYGSVSRNQLSTFVKEIPDEYIVMHDNRPQRAFTARVNTRPQRRDYIAEQAAKKPIAPTPVNIGIVFNAGDRVRHNIFGDGSVLEAKRMGNDTLMTIEFDTAGQKKLMANFARLTKI